MISAALDTLRLVKFSHSIFALPFALASAWLAAGGFPEAATLFWIVFCAVSARTAAMGFNRLVDRRLDAENPRTKDRELPSGALAPWHAALLVLVASVLFVFGAAALNPLCARLAVPVLCVLLGYSFAKRFTWMVHGVLGLALALAPLGAWVAVTGSLEGDLRPPLLLAGAVLLWVAGFDLIYACLDADFDRGRGLHSIPARFGVGRALALSSWLHVGTAVLLFALWRVAGLGWIFGLTWALACALLLWEHRLVRPGDLSRVDLAFFTLNGWVGVALFFGLALDLGFLGAG